MAPSDPADDGDYNPSSPTKRSTSAHLDPFTSPVPAISTKQRFASFDPTFFALAHDASPVQARKALQAHLDDTDRRMEEAGKLGTALVQQRKQLEERLKDLDNLQAEDDISPELREKLAEIEKEYNEVARESARAFLPKQRVPSNEAAAGSPFVPEGRSGRRSVSPSKYEAQATGSPTKLSVPNRKVRNQPANRIHDIEFATEISTSLIAQVRNLQALLAEKEEELREIKIDKSKLEYEAEGFQQRVKSLDESENRYKDENWNLETQIHELTTAQREAANREKKLVQSLNLLQAEKNAAQRELDETKVTHAKLIEEHAAVMKQHDIELGSAKRTLFLADSDKASLRKKIDDLTGQNTELARAFSSQRSRPMERESLGGISDDDFETADDNNTPEHSPPASPVKATPRHSLLETETLKTSLGHAQRTIQSLRTNYHREKTEKMELRRMLQDARDELEKARQDPGLGTSKRARKTESKEFKKPPRLLGGVRSVRSEVFAAEDSNWEDQPHEPRSPSRTSSISSSRTPRLEPPVEHDSDNFDTANDASDAAFETANERGNDTDFHTGAEEFSSDDDVQTETESPSKRTRGSRNRPTGTLTRSDTLLSSASTEDDEYPFEHDTRSPNALPPLQAKFPLRVSRGANRRSRYASEEPNLQSSPISFATSSATGTPQQAHVQSLAAELGDFDGSDNDSTLSGTPSRRSLRARTASPPPSLPTPRRLPMVESGTMTGHDLGISGVHSVSVESLPEPDTHSAELAALKEEHEEQIRAMQVDHAATIAAALAALRTEHAAELQNVAHQSTDAQAAALDALKADHAAQLAQVEATLRQEHAREIESLTMNHGKQADLTAAAAAATLAKELDALKSAHADELTSKLAERETAHSASLKDLETSHAEVLAQNSLDSKSQFAKEIEVLKAAHSQEVEKREAELKGSFESELQALRAQHDEEKISARKESEAAHLAAVAALSATHVKQLEDVKREMGESAARELDSLKALHEQELTQLNDKSASTLAEQIDSTKQLHAKEIEDLQKTLGSAHSEQLEALKKSHESDLDALKTVMTATHEQEVKELGAAHEKKIAELQSSLAASHTQEVDALRASHKKALELMQAAHVKELDEAKAMHSQKLEETSKKQDELHAAAIAALTAAHVKELSSAKSENEGTLSKELASLKDSHAQAIENLKNEHATAHAQELESFKTALAKQVESSKAEGNAAHSEQLEALNAANAQIIEAHKRESEQAQALALDQLKASHEKLVYELKQSHAAQLSEELDRLTASHTKELEASALENSNAKAKLLENLQQEHTATLARELEALKSKHAQELQELQLTADKSRSQAVDELMASHTRALEELRSTNEQLKAEQLQEVKASHSQELERLRAEHETSKLALGKELMDSHAQALEQVRSDADKSKSAELAALAAAHAKVLEESKTETGSSHAEQLSGLRREHEAALAQELEALRSKLDAEHSQSLAASKADYEASRTRDLEAARAKENEAHLLELQSLQDEHNSSRAQALQALKDEYDSSRAQALQALKDEHEMAMARSVEELKASHSASIAALKDEHQAALVEALDKLRSSHAVDLENVGNEHTTRNADAIEALKTSHAEQLEQVAKSNDSVLAQRLESMKAEHGAALEHLQKRHASEMERLLVAHTGEMAALRRSLTTKPPALSFSTLSVVETEPVLSDLQGPKRDASIIPRENGHAPRISQDSDAASIDTVRVMRRSQDSVRHQESALPPLPANHREAIEAARTQSSSGGQGSMGPPLVPASAYRPSSSSRPRTPASQRPMSPQSTTSRGGRPFGHAEVQSGHRLPSRSRQSSVSSFASEIDTRFNIRGDMAMEAAGFGPNTDPRMIQAITQTMIGEYLWKYTRKAGRGEMSGNRHRRYFWVHPYTRTLYWGDRDPSTAGRAELKAKSVPIEAVRVVNDDNPMPPGLHRKSLIVIAPGRTVKFTCTTGQRHETWFNALSYLLLRTGTEDQAGSGNVAGHVSQDEVDEFNPPMNRRANGSRPSIAPSMSSYHSRTTRDTDSPQMEMNLAIPTLTPTHERVSSRPGTFSRISGYLKTGSTGMGSFGSRRIRGHVMPDDSIYEASEAHDSAEDLRQMIEQQDRDADMLEDVRQCCDGKHNVGSLSHKPHRGRGRLSSLHGHPSTHNHATGA